MTRFSGIALAFALMAAPTVLDSQVHEPRVRQGQAMGPRGASIAVLLQQRADLNLSTAQIDRLEAIQQHLQNQNAPVVDQLRASMAAQRVGVSASRPSSGSRFSPEQRRRILGGDEGVAAEQRAATRQQMRQRLENATPEQREAMRQQLRQRLENTTPEQLEAMRQQIRERRDAAGGPGAGTRALRGIPEELRPVTQQIQENTRAALEEARGVLTVEQRTRLMEIAAQRRAEFRDRSGSTDRQRGSRGNR